MVDPTELAPLLAVLRDLVAWWQAGKIPGVVIGGLAASLLGRPRLTRDVDALVLVEESNWGEFMAAGLGMVSACGVTMPWPLPGKPGSS
jgi:hypothetical protein